MAANQPLAPNALLLTTALACWLGFALTTLWVFSGQSAAFDLAGLEMWRRISGHDPLGPPWLTQVMQALTTIGSGPVRLGLAATFCAYLLFRRRYQAGGMLAATAISAALANAGLKQLFLRPRPTILDHLTYADGLSFPSGHAFNSAAVFLMIALALPTPEWPPTHRRAAVTSALLLAVLIAFSRIWLGVHYPTDAIAGLLGGTGWALAAYGLAGTRPTNRI